MPVVDGLEVLKFGQKRFPQTPVVAMSGLLVSELVDKIMEMGAVTTMAKPFRLADIQAALQIAQSGPSQGSGTQA